MSSYFKEREQREILLRSFYLNSDLIWKRKSGQQTSILAKNLIYSKGEISYWFEKKIDLDFELQLNYDWLEQGALLIEELESFETGVEAHGKDRLNWRLKFLEWIGKSLWKDSDIINHDDVLTLMMCCYFDLDGELEEHFNNFAHEVKMRNCIVASYMIVSLVCCGYTNHVFLKDAFNTCLFLDYPYCLTMWSEREKKSMTRARGNKVLTEIERSQIFEKNNEYKDNVIPLVKKQLVFKDTVHLLQLSFERLDGEGFPNHIDYSNLNDMELSLIFLINSFDYKASFVGQSASRFLYEKLKESDSFLSTRLSSLMERGFEQEKLEFLKVSGI
jgi:hypothetical protein